MFRGIFSFHFIAERGVYRKQTDEEVLLLNQGILKYTFKMFTLILK